MPLSIASAALATPSSMEAVLPTYLTPGMGVARLDAWRARH